MRSNANSQRNLHPCLLLLGATELKYVAAALFLQASQDQPVRSVKEEEDKESFFSPLSHLAYHTA
jgi:hypothetical protein